MGRQSILEAKLAQSWPPESWGDVTVLLAISGGADSVALLRAMANLRPADGGRLVAAHFNHRLRGAEAAADESFVVQLSRQLDIPCEVGRADAGRLKAAPKQGLEAAARKARYRFLQQTAHRVGARYVATAHTADDQAETVLHRILRGTGLNGLGGIRRARLLADGVALIRPLLEIRRAELLEYLASLNQPFRDDSTNRRPQFTRNRIRRDLLPKLAAQYNERVVEALLRLANLAADAQSVIDQLTAELAERCVREGRDGVEIDCTSIAGANRCLVRELLVLLWKRQNWPLRAMGYAQWEELASLAASPAAASPLALPGGVTALKSDRFLVLQHRKGG
jgi:tRNA(Ile)-lysidine synthase